jgi:hypothetical protein
MGASAVRSFEAPSGMNRFSHIDPAMFICEEGRPKLFCPSAVTDGMLTKLSYVLQQLTHAIVIFKELEQGVLGSGTEHD